MLRKVHFILGGAAALAIGAAASAAPILDGSRDALYGAPKSVQLNGTGFGNSTLGNPLTANGSEINAAYGVVFNDTLYLLLTGNLETNFNKLDLFIDSKPGGQNKLRGDNPDVDFNGLNRMGDDGSGNGLRFDAGFESDYFLMYTGGDTGGQIQYFSNFAETNTGGGGAGGFIGGSANNTTLINGSNGIILVADQSNTLGVNVQSAPFDSDPATVLTGIEIAIPLSVIGNPTGAIHITAFINGSSHDFMSNQLMGTLPAGTGNLGDPRGVDLSAIPGNQFFTVVVPEPATLGLLAAAGAMLLRRRK